MKGYPNNDTCFSIFHQFSWRDVKYFKQDLFPASKQFFKEILHFLHNRANLRYYIIVEVQRNFIAKELLFFREQCPTCWPPFNFDKYVNIPFFSSCSVFTLIVQFSWNYNFFLFLFAGHWLSEKIMFSTTTRFWLYSEKCVTM